MAAIKDFSMPSPEDTIQRCLAILSMWLTDNPNMTLEVGTDAVPREDGIKNRYVYFNEVREKSWEKQND